MSIFRIKVFSPGRPRVAFVGIFASSLEATCQALADWPQATSVSVIRISGRAS